MKIRVEASFSIGEKTFKFEPLYSGGTLWIDGFDCGMVLDISGVEPLPEKVAACFDHNREQVVGTFHPEIVETEKGSQICGEGVFDVTAPAWNVLKAFQVEGVKWECSIATEDFSPERDVEWIQAGECVSVNGKKFVGPVGVVRKWALAEGSFVRRGGDAFNTASISARLLSVKGKGMSDELRAFIQEANFDPDALTPEQIAMFEKAFAVCEARIKAELEEVEKNCQAEIDDDLKPADDADGEPSLVDDEENGDISADDLDPEESPDGSETEEDLEPTSEPKPVNARASRKYRRGKVTASAGAPSPKEVFGVALMKSFGMEDRAIKASGYSDNAMSEGLAGRFSSYSPRDLICEMIRQSTGRVFRGTEDAFMEAFFKPKSVRASAFSTSTPLGILSEVINKFYVSGIMSVNDPLQKIAKRIPVNSLRTALVTNYDVYGVPEETPYTGRIADTTLVGEDYNIGIGLDGSKLTLTRDMMVNDDLNALPDVSAKLGRKQQLKRVKRGLKKLMDGATGTAGTFTTGVNKSTVPLSLEGLNTLAGMLASMTDIGSDPNDPTFTENVGKYLLVPTELAATADSLYTATNLLAQTAGGTVTLTSRRHRFEVIDTPYIGAGVNGGSATNFFLLADPQFSAILGETRLRGSEEPRIMQVAPPPNILGASWVCYFEYGFGLMDKRGAVYSTGAGA
ncbi:MAG: hypothetical protein Q4C70_01440 [Planctomycetia bacterium]|nr:hypothetical protein [Planctomycetia bacterium]